MSSKTRSRHFSALSTALSTKKRVPVLSTFCHRKNGTKNPFVIMSQSNGVFVVINVIFFCTKKR